MVNNERYDTKVSQRKDYWCPVSKRTQQMELKKYLENWYSKTSLKWTTESADQKYTLDTEIGKEESVSTHILVAPEERLLQSFTQKQKSPAREKIRLVSDFSTTKCNTREAVSTKFRYKKVWLRTLYLAKLLKNKGNRHIYNPQMWKNPENTACVGSFWKTYLLKFSQPRDESK